MRQHLTEGLGSRWRAESRREPARENQLQRVAMLLENLTYPEDTRVRMEAESLVAAGHSVEVIAPRGRGQAGRDLINGVRVRRFRAPRSSGQGLATIVIEYLVGVAALHLEAARALLRGATVLHIHNPPDILFPAGLLFRLAGRRVVFDHHDLAPELVAVKFGAGRLVRWAEICERLTFAVANHVLATNQSYAAVALRRGGKRADEVTVVRNGPPASWTQLPLQVRDGALDPVRVAYVGAMGSQDGVDGIAGILAALRERHPELRVVLTVIGEGGARPAFETALARLGVSDMVRFEGWVRPEYVPELVQNADVCIDPAPATTLNESSTMIKLTEYLALGKPTIAYDLRESRCTLGDAGILVKPGDVGAFAEVLARLSVDPELRRSLAERARRRAADLTWEQSEPALLGAYAAVNGSAPVSGQRPTGT